MLARVNCLVAAAGIIFSLTAPSAAATFSSETAYYFNTVDNSIFDLISINAAQYPLPPTPGLPNGVTNASVLYDVDAELSVTLIMSNGTFAGGGIVTDGISAIYGVSNGGIFESNTPPKTFGPLEFRAFGAEGFLIDQTVTETVSCSFDPNCATLNPGPISFVIDLPAGLQIVDEFATPLPSSLPLLASSLAILSLIGWRKSRVWIAMQKRLAFGALRLLAATALVVTATSANADVIQTYSISGTAYATGPYFGGTISAPADGILTLDYTLGIVESASFTSQSNPYFNLGWFNGQPLLEFSEASVPIASSFSLPLIQGGGGLDVPVEFNLSDQINGLYTDGTISGSGGYYLLIGTPCASINFAAACAGDNVVGYDGTLSITPIPATLPLFAAGLSAIGLLGWHRRKSRACQR